MSFAHPNAGVPWRALLVLGRVSNVPTVWSNCLAGWWLGGGGSPGRFLLLCAGATCLYIGGMYLNDAFDAEFDRQHRRERPIPSGAISLEAVWKWSFLWMALGMGSLMALGKTPLLLTLLLAGAILLYDVVHKWITFSPVLMAQCRFLLFLLAASAGRDGVTGLAVWSALVLGAYIVGLSYVAKFESVPGALRYWPLVLLAAPLVLAWIVNDAAFRRVGVLLSLVLAGWVFWCLRWTFWDAQRNFGRTVSGLLAGIVLVDLLALGGGSWGAFFVFALLFGAALLFQRFIPAT